MVPYKGETVEVIGLINDGLVTVEVNGQEVFSKIVNVGYEEINLDDVYLKFRSRFKKIVNNLDKYEQAGKFQLNLEG